MEADDGLFFINFKSFRSVFNKIFVARDFPDEWGAVRFESYWDKECSGGLPIEGTPAANIRYAKNPQYFFIMCKTHQNGTLLGIITKSSCLWSKM